jgi:hypothetical protein
VAAPDQPNEAAHRVAGAVAVCDGGPKSSRTWHYQLLPEDRLAELMADLFGVKLVAATIAKMSRTCAARLQDFAAKVRDLLRRAVGRGNVGALPHPEITPQRPTPWLAISDSNFDGQIGNSSV